LRSSTLKLDVAHERLDVLLTVEQEQVAVLMKRNLLIHFIGKVPELANAQQRHLNVHVRRKLMTEPSRTSSGRTKPDHVFLFKDHDIPHSSFREVIGDAQAHDPATDDHDFGCLFHFGL